MKYALSAVIIGSIFIICAAFYDSRVVSLTNMVLANVAVIVFALGDLIEELRK